MLKVYMAHNIFPLFIPQWENLNNSGRKIKQISQQVKHNISYINTCTHCIQKCILQYLTVLCVDVLTQNSVILCRHVYMLPLWHERIIKKHSDIMHLYNIVPTLLSVPEHKAREIVPQLGSRRECLGLVYSFESSEQALRFVTT